MQVLFDLLRMMKQKIMNEKQKIIIIKMTKTKKVSCLKIKFKTFFFLYMKMLFVDTDGYIGGYVMANARRATNTLGALPFFLVARYRSYLCFGGK